MLLLDNLLFLMFFYFFILISCFFAVFFFPVFDFPEYFTLLSVFRWWLSTCVHIQPCPTHTPVTRTHTFSRSHTNTHSSADFAQVAQSRTDMRWKRFLRLAPRPRPQLHTFIRKMAHSHTLLIAGPVVGGETPTCRATPAAQFLLFCLYILVQRLFCFVSSFPPIARLWLLVSPPYFCADLLLSSFGRHVLIFVWHFAKYTLNAFGVDGCVFATFSSPLILTRTHSPSQTSFGLDSRQDAKRNPHNFSWIRCSHGSHELNGSNFSHSRASLSLPLSLF